MSDGSNPQVAYLAAIQNSYEVINDHFEEVYDQCASADQKQNLRSLHVAARDTYWRAVAVQLKDDNPVVCQIYDELQQANQNLRDLIANMQNISAFISLMTQAVRLASSLVTLATVA
jgi:hypothetical protein